MRCKGTTTSSGQRSHPIGVSRNESVFSANSNTGLIRSDSRVSDGLQTPTSSPVKPGYLPRLETVGESSTDDFEQPIRGRLTDPTHRRRIDQNIQEDWQRTLPNHLRPKHSLPLHPQFDNAAFRQDGDTSITSIGVFDDEDLNEAFKNTWEKFDEADNMAARLEMDSSLQVTDDIGTGPPKYIMHGTAASDVVATDSLVEII